MNRIIRFGIIGCGTISHWYAGALAAMDRAELTRVYDAFPEPAKAFSKQYGVAYCTDLEEFLASDLDAVCVCTPSGLHARCAVAAARAGKHIVVEKPMGITTAQLDEIEKACAENKVKLCAVSQLLFSDGARKVRRAVDEGKLGRPILGDAVMKYFRSEEYYRRGGWRGTWEMDGGGALMNQGIHGVSLLLYLMGPVRTVTALTKTLRHSIEVEDTAAALLEFENGALGYLVGTTSVTPGLPRVVNLHGTRGSITLTEDAVTQWDLEGEPPLPPRAADARNTANDPTGFSTENHRRQLDDFIDALQNGTEPKLGPREGRRPVDLILAVYRSAETGKTVTLGR